MNELAKGVGALAASFFAVALVTTFVLPNRPTPTVIRSFFEGLTAAIRSTIGASAPGAESPGASSQRLATAIATAERNNQL